MIETINKVVVAIRQTLRDTGREPTPEELAEKLAVPLEKLREALDVARAPITLPTPPPS